MTHFSNTITHLGPMLNVVVGASQPRITALQAAGLAMPPPQPAVLLIDTGASHSCICTSILAKLGISPTGAIQVHTPTTGAQAVMVPQYDIGIVFTGLSPQDVHVVQSLSVTGNDFTAQGIGGLLGRDVLARAHLFYNGRENLYFLSF